MPQREEIAGGTLGISERGDKVVVWAGDEWRGLDRSAVDERRFAVCSVEGLAFMESAVKAEGGLVAEVSG